jgi:hypothetical protein
MAAPVSSKRSGTDSAVNPGQNDDFPTVKPTHEYKDGDGFSPQPASRSMTSSGGNSDDGMMSFGGIASSSVASDAL